MQPADAETLEDNTSILAGMPLAMCIIVSVLRKPPPVVQERGKSRSLHLDLFCFRYSLEANQPQSLAYSSFQLKSSMPFGGCLQC